MKVEVRKPITVFYEGIVVGKFFADLLVEDRVIIELKAVRQMNPIYDVQLVNYLKATGIEMGLLINFGERGVEVKRKHRDYQSPDTTAIS